MWLFTKHGFYSVVCAKADGGRGPGLDESLHMIRGRRRVPPAANARTCCTTCET
jgi:hypothetical protein